MSIISFLNRSIRLALALLCLLSVMPLSAQQHTDLWDFSDYFPKDYFYDEEEDWDRNDAVGEVVNYMRLAGVKPLRDITLNKGGILLRLNYIPIFAHPLFIQVQKKDDSIWLSWQKGKAVNGQMEHDMNSAISYMGYEDVSEDERYGNEWTPGIADSGSRQLTLAEWQQVQAILTDIDFIHYPHCIPCSGDKTSYILEYKDDRKSISYYTECSDIKKENRVKDFLVSLVDTDYVDMNVYYTGEIYSTVAPSYPGGEEACAAFVQSAIRYPQDALENLVEYRARVNFIVEKDGSISRVYDDSWPKSSYGFARELIRVVKSMPKWTPATQKGKNVRCYVILNYHFVLPDEIRPQYGHPILETPRDKRCWESIKEYHRRLLKDPSDQEASLWMGKLYYREYVLEHKPVKAPNHIESFSYRNDWDSFYDRTPVVSHAGDSALKYFYKVLELNPTEETVTHIYVPILQLEQLLQRPHHPLAELPFDTLEGVHFPYTSLINWPPDGAFDAYKDCYGEAWESYFWVGTFSKYLTEMKEPVIFDGTLQDDEKVFRLSFYPSFHPKVSFRVVVGSQKATLVWKILTLNYNPSNGGSITYSLQDGQQEMTALQYKKFLRYMDDVRLDSLPRSEFEPIMDGSQWVIERKDGQGFKAHFTNVPSAGIPKVFGFLAKVSGVKNYRMRRH